MLPLSSDSSPSILRAKVDLPQPDSPTRPRHSPLRIENEIFFTDVGGRHSLGLAFLSETLGLNWLLEINFPIYV